MGRSWTFDDWRLTHSSRAAGIGHNRTVADLGLNDCFALNAAIQRQLLIGGKSAELNCQYWPAAQGMLAVRFQRRLTDD
jgi:hypothetical protein